nr:hypothetical protein [uncultured Desulfuromonas sp.]
MALTRDFKETVAARAKVDKEFRQGLLIEAINAVLEGDIEIGKSLIRHYLNATGNFSTVADQLEKDVRSVRRMVEPSSNPTLKNFSGIVKACCTAEKLTLHVCPQTK